MRILLTTHLPLAQAPVGPFVRSLAQQLASLRHSVRVFSIESDPAAAIDLPGRRVLCRPDRTPVDLPLVLPGFSRGEFAGQTFADLTDAQFLLYRDRLREWLDAEIDAFDPHMIHVQHVWLLGHLALEAGVPYVVTVWGPELSMFVADRRFERLVQETAENAGRLFVTSAEQAQEVRAAFGELETEIVTICPGYEVTAECRDQLLGEYRQVLVDRFGNADRP
jgi:hypothetical protein